MKEELELNDDESGIMTNIKITGSKNVEDFENIISCNGVEFDYGAEEEEALMGSYF